MVEIVGSGNADPSDQEEQKAECDLERCSNKIHDGEQRQDGSLLFREDDGGKRRYGDGDPRKPTEFLR